VAEELPPLVLCRQTAQAIFTAQNKHGASLIRASIALALGLLAREAIAASHRFG